MFMFIHNSRRGIVRSFGKHVQYSNCKCYFIHRSTAWIIWCTFEDFHIKTSFQRLFAGGGGGGGDRESMWNFRLFRFRYLLSWLRYSRHLVFCLSQRFHGTQLYHCRISYLKYLEKVYNCARGCSQWFHLVGIGLRDCYLHVSFSRNVTYLYKIWNQLII